ncbi:MAG: DUF1996 domain-containing protein [Chloroflexota bacterium]
MVTLTVLGLLQPAPAMAAEAPIPNNFVSRCLFSHMAADDPIVHPGVPGDSHNHTFVGNVSTDAFSTLESLSAAATTCHRLGDLSAYWMPTLYLGAQPVAPSLTTLYYRRRTAEAVREFPAGLRVIAGDAHASGPQSLAVTYWDCGAKASAEIPRSSSVPWCPNKRAKRLQLHVVFPDCWDGLNLDAVDHKSHMAYSSGAACPDGYPVALPQLTFNFAYAIRGGPNVSLASGGQFTAHADFFNAWDEVELQGLIDRCLNIPVKCGRN